MRTGFSLVELSIVLVIIGLLVGGVLAGKALIHAAELRSISTEADKFRVALRAFEIRYFAYPGDLSNATAFWGSAGNCTATGGATLSGGTCNAVAADGAIGYKTASPSGQWLEMYYAWHHLSLAGLVEGTYTGLTGAGGAGDAVAGVNIPKAKYGSINGWCLGSPNWQGAEMWQKATGKALTFGVDDYPVGCGTAYPFINSLYPEEAWNIDTKTDDGIAGSGKVGGAPSKGCTNAWTDDTRLDAAYTITGAGASVKSCNLIFFP